MEDCRTTYDGTIITLNKENETMAQMNNRELIKDTNRVTDYLYNIRNVWREAKPNTPYVNFDGAWGKIEYEGEVIGSTINPTGNSPTKNTKTWNKRVEFPLYPRLFFDKTSSNLQSKISPDGTEGDYDSFIANGSDFIRLNLQPINKRHFIRLGVFLEFLQHKVIPKIETNKSPSTPMLLIDTNPVFNICYVIDNVISLDLNKILISNMNFFVGDKPVKIFDGPKPFPEKLSWNPDDGPIWGNIMNIYINFARIEEIFENVDENNGISIYSILKELATDINSSLGNINNIEPIIDKETNTIKFIDQPQSQV